PENEKEKKMTATSGRKCLESFGRFNHVGLWARTFSALLIGMEGWYSTKCRLIWKLKGTKYKRMYFQLVPSTHHIEEIEFGLLLSTPSAMQVDRPSIFEERTPEDLKKMSRKEFFNRKTISVLDSVKYQSMLPTPNASDHPGKNTGKRKQDSIPKRLRESGGKTSQLNPQFIMEMMGFPNDWTLLPFLNGETNQSKQGETQ